MPAVVVHTPSFHTPPPPFPTASVSAPYATSPHPHALYAHPPQVLYAHASPSHALHTHHPIPSQTAASVTYLHPVQHVQHSPAPGPAAFIAVGAKHHVHSSRSTRSLRSLRHGGSSVPSPSPYPIPPSSLPPPLPHAHTSHSSHLHSHKPLHDPPAHNTVPLTRPLLLTLLTSLSTHLLTAFGHQITLLAHGGAVMLLHPDLHGTRTDTRDVDVIVRAFAARYGEEGRGRLVGAVGAVAREHGVGMDWLNGGPDVALPYAYDPPSHHSSHHRHPHSPRTHTHGQYDPIARASLEPHASPSDVHTRTLFTSPGLRLVAIPFSWSLALKLVRYTKRDPSDARAVVRVLYWRYKVRECGDARELEAWVVRECGEMGYEGWTREGRDALRARCRDVVRRAASA